MSLTGGRIAAKLTPQLPLPPGVRPLARQGITPISHPRRESLKRKLAITVIALTATLGVSAIAYAAATNSYSVQGGVTPTKAATPKSPRPVSVRFNYQVVGPNGAPPAAVKTYSIDFYGVRSVNGKYFPSCTNFQNNTSDSKCKAGAVVGTGKILNRVYQTSNPSNAFDCQKSLKIYNSSTRKHPNTATIYIYNAPGDQCSVAQSFVFPAFYKKAQGGGTTLVFTVPQNVLHPLPVLTVAVTSVQSNIKLLTQKVRTGTRRVRRNGRVRRIPVFRRVGYYEKVNCLSGRTPLTVTFGEESGGTGKATYNGILCK